MKTTTVLSAVPMAFPLALLLACAGAVADEPGASGRDAQDDWLRIVPNDVRFYVEMRDLAGVRDVFQSLGIWQTVRELTEKDIPSGSTPWRKTTQEHLGLTPEAAITQLLGRRTAIMATDSSRWQSGVVLTELEHASDLRVWLRRWRARPLAEEGPIRRFELHGGILLAVLDRTLALGPAGDPEGLWGRPVLLLSGREGGMLAGRSEYAALKTRLSREYPGLLYVAWSPGDAEAIGGCTRLLAGVEVNREGIVCELHGQRPGGVGDGPSIDAAMLARLPDSTLALYAGTIDFASLSKRIAAREFKGWNLLLSVLAGLLAGDDEDATSFLSQLGPTFVVLLGKGKSSAEPGFQLPSLGVICRTKAPGRSVERLDFVLGSISQLLSLMSFPKGPADVWPNVEVKKCEDIELHYVQVGPLLAARTDLAFLKAVEPCWAILDDKLVLSTSVGHIEEIVRTLRGKQRPNDKPVGGLRPVLPESRQAHVSEWAWVNGTALAQTCGSWLTYMERARPETLEPAWWQHWATERMEHRTRLGVGLVVDETDRSRAVVAEVTPDSPAHGILHGGDIIVAVQGESISGVDPAREIAGRYLCRGATREFAMRIIRDGKKMDVVIPVIPAQPVSLQDFDPVRALRQLVTLSGEARTASVTRYAVGPDRFDARIDVRWQRTQR